MEEGCETVSAPSPSVVVKYLRRGRGGDGGGGGGGAQWHECRKAGRHSGAKPTPNQPKVSRP